MKKFSLLSYSLSGFLLFTALTPSNTLARPQNGDGLMITQGIQNFSDFAERPSRIDISPQESGESMLTASDHPLEDFEDSDLYLPPPPQELLDYIQKREVARESAEAKKTAPQEAFLFEGVFVQSQTDHPVFDFIVRQAAHIQPTIKAHTVNGQVFYLPDYHNVDPIKNCQLYRLILDHRPEGKGYLSTFSAAITESLNTAEFNEILLEL
tara:strand:- start:11 stop:640 length:630 start_codon:yes stop_codon:yes gene_type:complete